LLTDPRWLGHDLRFASTWKAPCGLAFDHVGGDWHAGEDGTLEICETIAALS